MPSLRAAGVRPALPRHPSRRDRAPGSPLAAAALAALPTVATVTAALTAVVLIPAPAHADPVGSGWSLVFNDDFDATAVDEAKWNYRLDTKQASAGALTSVQKKENVVQAGGVMSILLTRNAKPDGSTLNYSGGGLVSKQKFRYGYYESRIKFNATPGWHSSFWLQTGDGTTTFPSARRTEIDVFEYDSVNSGSNQLKHNIIRWNSSGQEVGPRITSNNYNVGSSLTDWHTYAVEWNEQGTTFYIDGSPYYPAGVKGGAARFFAYPPSLHEHDKLAIWLTTIAYGNTWPQAADLPDQVQFDYVRYWQKDYYIDIKGAEPGEYAETGHWQASSLKGWTQDSPSRYADCGVAGAKATWTPTLQAAGSYQVFAYNIVHSLSDPNLRVDVAGTTTTINGTTGSSGWVSLGTFSLPAGAATSVVQTSSGTGCARANAVKFVRVG